jgi:hypothetical protein
MTRWQHRASSAGALALILVAATAAVQRTEAGDTGAFTMLTPVPAVGTPQPGPLATANLPSTCQPGQVPVWTGSAWACGTVAAGGPARLEDLQGLPCNGGAETGSVSVAINPLTHAVTLSCPRDGQFQLDVAVGGPGTVSTLPPEIDCGSGHAACSNAYAGGATITLTAAHEADVAAFTGWSGACSGPGAACQVVMDQPRQVTAIFVPTLDVNLRTSMSNRLVNCYITCVYTDVFTDSFARVTVLDLDTSSIVGTCDSDTTVVVPASQFAPPSYTLTTCHVPVQPGHHLSLQADDATLLGGNQIFTAWAGGGCDGATGPVCTPAAPVTVHDEVAAFFN